MNDTNPIRQVTAKFEAQIVRNVGTEFAKINRLTSI